MATFFVSRASVAQVPLAKNLCGRLDVLIEALARGHALPAGAASFRNATLRQPVTVREFPRGSALASPVLLAMWQLLARIHLGTGDRSAARYS